MTDWYLDKEVIIAQTETTLTETLILLLDDTQIDDCADYWVDNTHNIHAYVTGDNEELWVEAKMELYSTKDEYIGDLRVYDTKDISKESFAKLAREIVKDYYME